MKHRLAIMTKLILNYAILKYLKQFIYIGKLMKSDGIYYRVACCRKIKKQSQQNSSVMLNYNIPTKLKVRT